MRIMERREASILRSIRTNSVRDPRSELSIVISRMQNSGNRRDRQIAINAAMMMRRGREPREIATAMLEGKTRAGYFDVEGFPVMRDGTRYDRRWNTLRQTMRGDSKQYIDEWSDLRTARASERKFDGRIFKETLRTTTKAEAREAAKRFRNMKTVSVPNSGLNYPVVVNARVLPRSGGYSVFVRAREITPSGMQIEAIQRVAAMEARLNTEALRRRQAWRRLR